MSTPFDQEAVDWLRDFLRSGEARNPELPGGLYRFDPKYLLSFVASRYGVDGDQATTRITGVMEELGGHLHSVVLDRSQVVTGLRAARPNGGWTEWRVARAAIDGSEASSSQ